MRGHLSIEAMMDVVAKLGASVKFKRHDERWLVTVELPGDEPDGVAIDVSARNALDRALRTIRARTVGDLP